MQRTREGWLSFDSNNVRQLSQEEKHCEHLFVYLGVSLSVCTSHILEEIVSSGFLEDQDGIRPLRAHGPH